jgi:tripartite-type tricarboxylate transporter receptor subunit TctC
VQVLFSAYPSLVGAVESKKVKLLAHNGPGRSFQAPSVPPIADMIPGFDLTNIVGIFGKPGIPQPVLDKIAVEAIAAISTPEAKRQFAAAGVENAGANGAAFDKALKREIDNVAAVVKTAGIVPQ